MKKLFVLFIFLSLCAPQLATSAKYSRLFFKVESNGERFLVDESDILRYYMGPPHVRINVDQKTAYIHPTVYYAPGTTYYGERYDNFYVLCSQGSVRYSVPTLKKLFGPEAGTFTLPKTTPGYLGTCTVWARVKDLEETIFESEGYTFHYSRNN